MPVGTIAYATSDQSGRSRIETIDGTGAHRALLTRTRGYPTALQWSPDGCKLAYIETPGHGSEAIAVVAAGGGEPRTLVTRRLISSIGWSPDGSELAFSAGSLPGTPDLIATVALVARPRVRVVARARPGWIVYDPAWSPDGRSLVYVTRRGPHSSAIIMTTPTRPASRTLARVDGIALYPRWSPTGGRLLFVVSYPQPNGDLSQRLYVRTPDGRLAGGTTASRFGPPAWSPDSGRIACVREYQAAPASSNLELFSAAGTRLTAINVDGMDALYGRVSFAPDSQHVAFLRSVPPADESDPYATPSDSYGYLSVADLRDSQIRRLTTSGSEHDPAWRPGRTGRPVCQSFLNSRRREKQQPDSLEAASGR